MSLKQLEHLLSSNEVQLLLPQSARITDRKLAEKQVRMLVSCFLEAGKLVRDAFHKPKHSVTEKASLSDLLTETDSASERIVVSHIQREFPDDGIIGEEGSEVNVSGADQSSVNSNSSSTGRHTWVIDPIDGTTNFIHGLPIMGISVGLVGPDGVPLMGGVYNCPAQELFFAYRGCGAFVVASNLYSFPNCQEVAPGIARIRPSKCLMISKALISASFCSQILAKTRGKSGETKKGEMGNKTAPNSMSPKSQVKNSTSQNSPKSSASMITRFPEMVGENLMALAMNCHDVRRVGACSMDICYVACGRLDAFIEAGPKPWDLAAGVVIAKEAGVECVRPITSAEKSEYRGLAADNELSLACGSVLCSCTNSLARDISSVVPHLDLVGAINQLQKELDGK